MLLMVAKAWEVRVHEFAFCVECCVFVACDGSLYLLYLLLVGMGGMPGMGGMGGMPGK